MRNIELYLIASSLVFSSFPESHGREKHRDISCDTIKGYRERKKKKILMRF